MTGDFYPREPAEPTPLSQLCDLLEVPAVPGTVTGVTLNSRAVMPGDLYAALPGANTHGARFAQDAVATGATAVMTDPDGAASLTGLAVPVIVTPDPRSVLGAVSALIYGHPDRHLRTFAVTGTNGKTTMTYMLAGALSFLGVPTGLIGTTGTWIGQEKLPTERTTPEAPDVHALMALMVRRGVKALAMEVSSHALVLGRVDSVVFDVAAFTNLSADHLDFHTTMEQYFLAKASLFTLGRTNSAVINVDDQWGRRMAQMCEVPATTYAVGTDADWRAHDIVCAADGSRFVATWDGRSVPVSITSPGEFNVANALGALAMLVQAGHGLEESAQALCGFAGVPGRMEVVRVVGVAGPTVIVDYAHTPDAVDRALDAVRPLTQGKIWCVLGCGGDRDREKRPVMGRIACQRADHLVVTDDNPRSEAPEAIRGAILQGTQTVPGAHVLEIADRGEAIRTAVERAEPADTVLVLGKGHETGQQIAGVVHPFDDRVVAAAALEERQ